MWMALVALLSSGWARAAVRVVPDSGCPAGSAIDENLERVGALALLARLGGAEVRVEEPSLMHVSLRDSLGAPIGARTVPAAIDCGDRAVLAAAVIAAFAGEWAQTEIGPTTPATPPTTSSASAHGDTVTVAGKPPTAGAAGGKPPWQGELGLAAFGLYDGDAGGWGLGGRLDVGRDGWGLTALAEGSSERAQPLGQGQGAYRLLRAGVGLAIRHRWARVWTDGTLVPMVARLSLRGKDLTMAEEQTAWQFVAAAQARLGWNGRRLHPFLFLGASYDTPAQRMVLRDGTSRVPLSRANLEAGVGISFGIWP